MGSSPPWNYANHVAPLNTKLDLDMVELGCVGGLDVGQNFEAHNDFWEIE
jgi:hypothetical protein